MNVPVYSTYIDQEPGKPVEIVISISVQRPGNKDYRERHTETMELVLNERDAFNALSVTHPFLGSAIERMKLKERENEIE